MAEPVPWPRGRTLARGRRVGRGRTVPVRAGRRRPVRLPVPVANLARKRDHPPTRNLSEIPKLNFEFRFLPGNSGRKTFWHPGKRQGQFWETVFTPKTQAGNNLRFGSNYS
jgi:hypothetical protein